MSDVLKFPPAGPLLVVAASRLHFTFWANREDRTRGNTKYIEHEFDIKGLERGRIIRFLKNAPRHPRYEKILAEAVAGGFRIFNEE